MGEQDWRDAGAGWQGKDAEFAFWGGDSIVGW